MAAARTGAPVVVSLPEERWVGLVGEVPGAEYVVWDLTGEPPRADEIAIVVTPYPHTPDRLPALKKLPNVEVVQALMAGYDGIPEHVPDGADLCNAAGVHDTATAELALALTLAAQRGIPDFVLAQEKGEWLRPPMRPGLADKRVMIVGYGGIGRAIATRMAAFEVDLVAVASKPRPGDDLVDTVHGIDEVHGLLPDVDIVVLVLPLSETTRGLVDADFLAAMHDDALLVNVGRGKIVDTDALLAEVGAGRLRAALDVTDPEPLPADHPLWRAPGVLISPHVGGPSQAFFPRAARLIREQTEAYVDGRDLRNVIDLGRD